MGFDDEKPFNKMKWNVLIKKTVNKSSSILNPIYKKMNYLIPKSMDLII